MTPMDERWPLWVRTAINEIGTHEIPGPDRDTGRILDYMRSLPGLVPFPTLHDEIPWCAAFVHWCLGRVGIEGTGKWNARSYLTWGRAAELGPGAIVVLRRGLSPWQGHVGFCVAPPRELGAHGIEVVDLLGGNQHNAVRIDTFARGIVLGVRWPLDDHPF